MLAVMDIFSLEFSSFLEDSNICYHMENESLFYLNKGMLCIKLVPLEDYSIIYYTPDFTGRYIILHQDRWVDRRDIVKSIIMGLSGKNRVIYARNTILEKINRDVAAQFHSTHHLIGYTKAKFNYGLRDVSDNSLLAVSSFSSSRKMLRSGRYVNSYEWVRYTSALGFRVVGGMSKMLSLFLKEQNVEEVMTYCDADWSNGKSYESMGFSLESKTGEIEYFIDKLTYQRTSLKKIRRDEKFNSPDLFKHNGYLLRTQGNLKFIASFE